MQHALIYFWSMMERTSAGMVDWSLWWMSLKNITACIILAH